MKSLATILCLAFVLLFSGVPASALATPPTATGGGPIIAQYSNGYGNNYGTSNNNGTSTRTGYRSYRGLFKLGAFVIFLIVSAVGYLIRKVSGE